MLLGVSTHAQNQGEVDLTWQPSALAKGYTIHWGTSGPGGYQFEVDVGDRLDYSLRGMADCTEHWIAAKAYNTRGDSGFSNEVACWPRPRVDAVTCGGQTSFPLNTATTCTIRGVNLRAGAVVVLSDSSGNPPVGVTISGTKFSEPPCNEITFELVVGEQSVCPGGCPLSLRVRNPSQVASHPLEGAIVIEEPPATPGGVRVN